MEMIKRIRQALLLIVLICGVLASLFLAMGCQPVGEPTPTVTPVPTATSTPVPASTPYPPPQGTLTLLDVAPRTLDPAISRDITSHTYVSQLFSGLVALDAELNIVPDIAQDWDVSTDGMVYTFYLRTGVRFHNGREVKAQDFKYSWERACNPRLASQTAADYLGDIVGVREVLTGRAEVISGVRVIDDYTLEVTIDAPKVYFLTKLTYPTAFVVDSANVESGGEWWRHPNGTGPFKLEEWKEDEQIVLECNRLYYREPVRLERVVFRLWAGIPMAMYEMGEIDVTSVGLADIDRVRDPANPLNQELKTISELSFYYLAFNTTRPPFDDVNVRRAFCHAVDKDKIVDLTLKGMVQQAEGILPPAMPGYNENLKGLDYDVDKARALIAASKYGSVSTLPAITLTTYGYGEVSNFLAAVVDMWRQNLGVDVVVRQLDPEVYFYSIKQEKDNMFDAGWVADYPDPQDFLEVLFHTGSGGNDSEYSNPEVDILLDKAAREQDTVTRMRLYQEVEQMLIDDGACLPLWFGESYILVKPYVKDYIVSPLGIPLLSKVHIEPH